MLCATLYNINDTGGGELRNLGLSLFLVLVLIIPFSINSYGWDSITSQIIPEDVAEKPPQISYDENLDQDIITRENFYNKSAGTNQYRRTIRTPQKNMNFKVYNPVDDPTTITSTPTKETSTEATIVEKDGKAVTVISIKEESVTKPKTK